MTAAQWLGLAVQASIVLTVFGFGLSAAWHHATYLFRHPALLLRAVLSMSVVMPTIAALIATLFALPFEVKVALVALALSPVPPIIQKKQVTAGARMDYVVGLLVAMSLLAVVVVPLTMTLLNWIFDRSAVLGPVAVAEIMGQTVLAPLLLGLLVRHFFPVTARASRPIIQAAMALLVIAVAILVYGMWPTIASFLRDGTLLALIAVAVIGLAVGHFLGGPVPADRTALALATTSRHPAVALAVTTAGTVIHLDKKPELAIILLYLVVATLISLPYQRWRAKAGHSAVA